MTARSLVQVGNWEIEVEEPLSREAFRGGKCFIAQDACNTAAAAPAVVNPARCTKAKHLSMKAVRPGAAPTVAAPTVLPPHALALNAGQVAAGTEQLVFLDASMSRKLRPHQVEGVKFLYSVRSIVFTPCSVPDNLLFLTSLHTQRDASCSS